MNVSRRGFTLLEMMVVTVIIAILAMIAAIPLRQVRERAMLSAVKQELHQAVDAIAMYEATHAKLPTTIIQLDSMGWSESGGVVLCRFSYVAGTTPYVRIDARHRGMKRGVQTRYPTWPGRYQEQAMANCTNIRGGTS